MWVVTDVPVYSDITEAYSDQGFAQLHTVVREELGILN